VFDILPDQLAGIELREMGQQEEQLQQAPAASTKSRVRLKR
jgi:hypothetical protein